MRVLIVDDDEGMSSVLSRLFTRWGWTLDARGTVSDAHVLFKERDYDLAVCDVDLPDGNGIDMAHAFLDEKPFTRILILSGDPGNLDKARDSGLSECLQKPFEFGELKALIEAPRSKTRSL